MTDRRARTILLLETRTAWHPQVRSQFATFGALPGEKATQRETCSQCNGETNVPTRTGVQTCPRCNGRGTYLVDAYTGYRSRDEGPWQGAAKVTAVEKRRQSDATIQRMALQVAPPRTAEELLEDANHHPEEWERSRAAHYQHGSYQELALALEWLRDRAPNMARLVVWVYELGLVAPGPETRGRAERGLDAIVARMPDPVRVPGWILPAHPAQDRVARRKVAA